MKKILLIVLLIISTICFADSNSKKAHTYDEQNLESEKTYSGNAGKREKKSIRVKEILNLIQKTEFMIQDKSKEEVFEIINNSEQLEEDELYVFAIDFEGNILAHGGDIKQVGQNQYNLKDSYNKYFIRNFINAMKKNDTAWEEYAWNNYETFEIQKKLTLLKRIDDNCFIGCGVYID